MKKKRYHYKYIILTAILLISYANNILAAEPEKLSLKGSLEIAYKNNPDIISARQELEAAKAGVIKAKAYTNPSFNFESRPSGIETELTQEITIPGKRSLSRKIAIIEKEIHECNLDLVWKNVSYEVKITYLQILLAKKKKKFFSESLDLARNFLNRTTQRYNVGKVLKNELLRAEIEVFRAQNEILLAEKEISSYKDKLTFLLNKPSSMEYNCVDKLLYQKKELDLETLIKQALSDRADIKAGKLEVESKKLELKLAQKERLSNPELSLLADREVSGPGIAIGVGVAMPLPFWYRNKGEITQLKTEKENAEHKKETLIKKAELEVKEVHRELKLSDRQVALMKKSIRKAEELLSLIEVQYAEGKTSFLSYLEALIVYKEANLDYLEAILDYRVKLALLERRIGGEL